MKAMVWFPIERRELLVFSRRPATYSRRLLVPVAVLCVVFLIFRSEGARLDQHEQGMYIFHTTAWITFFYALLSGFVLTSDCLSKEKREHTLGLLFLTDLRSFDIVLGKLVSHSIVALSGLVATLPLLMLPVLMGGITFRQVWQMAATLLCTMLLSLAAGLFASSLFRNGRVATGLALFLLVFLCLGGLLLQGIATNPYDPPQPHSCCSRPASC
ncbi:ABC transporter permease subunit [Fontisphaera persica]|uniref:ABC transporter permease n=1 Tax=Fontisphaera persica TaxID=2974023 RepID=UPI0024BF442B|nr:ABC transporter permease subunit [Fontisphaera persica]WCJ59619.1 ABC transporter permease subunit [Fontisphaera persica]